MLVSINVPPDENVWFVSVQDKLECSPKRDIEGMGVAEIKYGDSLCFVMHVATGLWLSYQAPDVKSARLGPLKRRVRFTCCCFIQNHVFHVVQIW